MFYRGVVHANEFGEQILGKILMSFWSPAKAKWAGRFLEASSRKALSMNPGMKVGRRCRAAAGNAAALPYR